MHVTSFFSAQAWAAVCVASVLAGCGSGGGSTSPVAPPAAQPGGNTPTALKASDLQGRWLTATGVTPAQVALVVPTAANPAEATMWLLSADLRSLGRLQVSTTGADGVTASGKLYALGGATPAQTVSYNGTANAGNGTMGLNGGALPLTRSDRLATPITLADVAGTWSNTAGNRTLGVNWVVGSDGAINAVSTTGCQYSGRLTSRTDAGVLDTTLNEVCGTVTTRFYGVTTYRMAQGSTPAALTLALVNTDAAASTAITVLLERR